MAKTSPVSVKAYLDRFTDPDDLPLDAIGPLIGAVSVDAFIATCEAARNQKR